MNVKITAESLLSLSVTWEPPEENKRNGEIVNYTVCISHEETKSCFEEYTTKEKMMIIKNLNASTKYYVRVLASTKVGPGVFSEWTSEFTNKGKYFFIFSSGEQTTSVAIVVSASSFVLK